MTKQEFLRNTSKLTYDQVKEPFRFCLFQSIFPNLIQSVCISNSQVTTMFDRLDMDGDGKLNKEEFDKLMAKAKNKKADDQQS